MSYFFRLMLVWFLLPSWELAAQTLPANCVQHLSGTVRDKDTREPLLYSHLTILENGRGATADEQGYYRIDSLCAGTYTLVCSHVACRSVTRTVQITDKGAAMSYDFVLPHAANELHEITVRGARATQALTQVSKQLSSRDLQQAQGKTLGEALSSIAGVSTLQTGQTIVKPIINGLHSQRIVLINNGIRQEGQQWGSEHAPEVDPLSAGKLTVIKGANAVQYGSDAIGGVIMVEPPAMPTDTATHVECLSVAATNGRGLTLGAKVASRLRKMPRWSWQLQGSAQRSGNLRSPHYYLANTGTAQYHFSGAVAYQSRKLLYELYHSQFNSQISIFSGSHIGNLTDLQQAFTAPEPLVQAGFSYAIARPRQQITHQLSRLRISSGNDRIGEWSIALGEQYNARQEYDSHRPLNDSLAALDRAELRLYMHTYTADMVWKHPHKGNFSGSVGSSSMYQRNRFGGRFFIPQYDAFTQGLFAIEHWHNQRWQLEAGVRYDYRYLQADLPAQQNLHPANPTYRWHNSSATVGAMYRLKLNTQITANIGTAWRAPHVSELFSNGVHHGAAAFEAGDAQLQPERSVSAVVGFRHQTTQWQLETNAFANRINHYIYAAPQNTTVLTIRGAFPLFRYVQTDALLAGCDLYLQYTTPNQRWQLSQKSSYVYGYNRSQHQYLILMPPLQLAWAAEYHLPDHLKRSNTYCGVQVQHVAQQRNVPPNSDFVAPPPAYTLLSVQAATELHQAHHTWRVGVEASNLLNTTYRSYLDRFRYFADAMGRNVTMRVNYLF